jgi:hypothetical protein
MGLNGISTKLTPTPISTLSSSSSSFRGGSSSHLTRNMQVTMNSNLQKNQNNLQTKGSASSLAYDEAKHKNGVKNSQNDAFHPKLTV